MVINGGLCVFDCWNVPPKFCWVVEDVQCDRHICKMGGNHLFLVGVIDIRGSLKKNSASAVISSRMDSDGATEPFF